jgi:magnesium chelatase subunit D
MSERANVCPAGLSFTSSVSCSNASAALDARDTVSPDDASLAARLVLSPRATRLPAAPPDESDADDHPDSTPENPSDDQPEPPLDADQPEQTPPPEEPPDNPADTPQTDDHTPPEEDPDRPDPDRSLDELILEAAKASIPAGLLARLAMNQAMASRGAAGGRAGARREGSLRGRPVGTRPGLPRDGARLSLIDTLRTAAPWQTLRRREIAASAASSGNPRRATQIEVRASDFRVARVQERAETITIFAVDASGSSALNRLAEAKGAVELLLADCYVRRDRVALLAFRGSSAELVLPPTRSLVRAKRALAGLPGGGGTPLALALDAAADLAGTLLRRGGTPVLVLLTDARANIARNGAPGRDLATADALASARQLRALGLGMLVVDTAPGASRPAAGAGPTVARQLSDALNARYLPLPQMDAAMLSRAARSLATPDNGRRPA